MDFEIPEAIRRKLAELDDFIEKENRPLEEAHPEYFDHRRYRITEGSEEIQLRRVAGHLFGFVRGPGASGEAGR